jgi:hypothetical protein
MNHNDFSGTRQKALSAPPAASSKAQPDQTNQPQKEAA